MTAEMQIRAVEPIVVRADSSLYEHMSFFVVRVETADGVVGYGEACDCFGVSYPRVLAAVVEDAIAPRLVGSKVAHPDASMRAVAESFRRELGAAWSVSQAMSAVEIALWDAFARSLSRSVSEMWGQTRTRVRVYAGSSPFLEEKEAGEHFDLLAPNLERGVSLVKMRIGHGWERALRSLRGLRDLLGSGVEIMVDGNEAHYLATALRIASELEDLDVRWFEEPVPHGQLDTIEHLASRAQVPLAYGEHVFGILDAERALNANVSVLQPDPSICGGFSEARRIADLAAARGARVVSHFHGGPVALAATLHFAASCPSVDVVELPVHLFPVLERLADGHEMSLDSIENGTLSVPEGAGLGVALARVPSA